MDTPLATLTRRLQDPQVMALSVVIVGSVLILYFFGLALGPVITAVVVAYLLEGVVRALQRLRIPRGLAVTLVFGLFLLLLLWMLFVLAPNLVKQLTQLFNEFPRLSGVIKSLLDRLAASASHLVDPTFAENLILRLVQSSQTFMEHSVAYLLQRLTELLTIAVYLLVVPFLVFFFLKDKELLIAGFLRFMPRQRDLLHRVWQDVDAGTGAYVRGKFLEFALLGVTTYWVFILMQVNYAFLLALFTGLSVFIPFLGVVGVTVPVIVLGVMQWGMTWDALEPLAAYTVLQGLDAAVVQPLILGEAVKVHPTIIILAVLFFGSLWGVLGVFFAVPLVVLVKSILDEIPRDTDP